MCGIILFSSFISNLFSNRFLFPLIVLKLYGVDGLLQIKDEFCHPHLLGIILDL